METITHGPITITALKWVPPFAKGQVRDHRMRWVLKEVGWEYKVQLVDPSILESQDYRDEQPFGQVPILRESGRPALFETGAIVLEIAERSGKLLPQDQAERSLARCWLFAALNSVEPMFSEVAVADFFLQDKELAKAYRTFAVEQARQRLSKLAAALGEKEWLVGGEFSVADLMMSSVTKIVHHTDLVEEHSNLAGWRDRCFARPAYKEAIEEQCAEISRHSPADMGWELPSEGGAQT